MEWPTKELENYFNFLNKIYAATMTQKHPYVLSVKMDPEKFIEEVINDRWSIDVETYFCVDWDLQRNEYSDIEGFGEDTVKILLSLQNMFEKPEEIKNKKIYPVMQINKKKYCEHLVNNTYE